MFLKSFVNKLRYLVWASPIVWLALLNGCGSGTVLDPFVPTRIIAFGDAFMDTRNPRFTVNDEIPSVAQAINTGVPIIHVNPHNAIVDVLRTMTQECDPNPIKKQSTWISRLIGT